MLIELLVALSISLAFMGQAIFGFGGGLVAIPLLSLVIDVREAVLLSLIFQFLVGFAVIPVLKHVAWKKIGYLLLGLAIFTALGTFFLAAVDRRLLEYVLVGYIFLFLGKEIFYPNFRLGSASPLAGFLSGALGGIFQGMLGAGGPNIVIYLKEILPDREQFRASVLFAVVFGNTIRLVLSARFELFSDAVINHAAWSILPFALAIYLGVRYRYLISEQVYQRTVYCLLFLSAVALLLK